MNRLPYFSLIWLEYLESFGKVDSSFFYKFRILSEMFNYSNLKFGKYFIINFTD